MLSGLKLFALFLGAPPPSAFAQCLLGLFALGNVERDSDHRERFAVRGVNESASAVEPSPLSICALNSELDVYIPLFRHSIPMLLKDHREIVRVNPTRPFLL